MINKAMIEIPPKFAGQPPIHPGATELESGWSGAAGLAEDVRYYGEWMKQEAFKRIGHLYPKAKDDNGNEYTVIAWIWARTVKCPNPACGCEMPLISSFVLSKKRGKEAFVYPIIEGKHIRYEIKYGKNAPDAPKLGRGAKFKCMVCGETAVDGYIKQESALGHIGDTLLGIVAEGNSKRLYISPDEAQRAIANCPKPDGDYPDQNLPFDPRNIWCVNYGLDTYDKLFTNRQLTTLSTFSTLVAETQAKVEMDAIAAGLTDAKAYGQALGVYLAFLVDQMTNQTSSLCTWHATNTQLRSVFSRQSIPMVWDYAECNVFSDSTGSFSNLLDRMVKAFSLLGKSPFGSSRQFDAQSDCGLRNVMVSTDPPYYDNISYADLSDFFYVWLRQSIKKTYPELFQTMLVPKTEELVASPYRFGESIVKARSFFENGMLQTCKQIYQYACEDVPVTIYYAYKQSEADDSEGTTASTGWETMLSAIIRAGFSITGTWPMRTELATRSIANETNALASSIVLVCRKRSADAPMCTRRDFINTLKRELKPALDKLRASNIAPVDLAQSAIGPGMGVYSRYSKVLEADGTPMSVRSALQIINQELDLYFNEQDGELDRESRFCVELYTQCAFNDIRFGEADVLARAKNTSVDKLRSDGVLYSEKGVVRLLTREELPVGVDKDTSIWLLTQQLTYAMETDGVEGAAKIVSGIYTSEPERAKDLAYRLFSVAERRGWTSEAFAYNSLVTAWPDVQSRAADMSAAWNNTEQQSLFGSED